MAAIAATSCSAAHIPWRSLPSHCVAVAAVLSALLPVTPCARRCTRPSVLSTPAALLCSAARLSCRSIDWRHCICIAGYTAPCALVGPPCTHFTLLTRASSLCSGPHFKSAPSRPHTHTATMSDREDLTMEDEKPKMEVATPTAAAAAASSSPATAAAPSALPPPPPSSRSLHLTRADKKYYVDNPHIPLPLRYLGSELKLSSGPCTTAESGAKNCRHNCACMHGLGWKKKGIWDSSRGGAAVQSLLGDNPHWKEMEENSHVGLRNLGATSVEH